MGLDMRFISGKVNDNITENDREQLEKCEEKGGLRAISYMRKHSDLHGFLTNIWLKTRPEARYTDFNLEYLEITPEIVHEMEELANDPPSMHYSGFFWGESTLGDWENTKILCKEIREAFANGERVFYSSWW